MTIGINAAAVNRQPRTGVEEYVYQLVRHLAGLEKSRGHRFLLYSKGKQGFDFALPSNFKIEQLKWNCPMWTQIRLAYEMAVRKPDLLFVPVHILPLIHPDNSVAAIQGLEYEYYPELYPFRHLQYLRWAAKYALKNALEIITPSQSTRNDLIKLYGARPEKIRVVPHGFDRATAVGDKAIPTRAADPYILYIGRLETKKNLQGLLRAFGLLKEKYKVAHKLVLAGAPGYGYHKVKSEISKLKSYRDVIERGYVSQEEKWRLLAGADLFAFVSFYEGFGFPILEAQSMDCPVITADVSSMPEVAGRGAVLVNPKDIEIIAQSMYKLIKDNQFKKDLINKGRENIKRFSWTKCAEKTLAVLVK